MIFTERQITVHKGKSSINEPVILYRGDYEVSIKFTIMKSEFKFKNGINLAVSEKATHGQLAILAPYGGNIFSEIVKCEDGTVTFTLTKEMIDQLEEVGLYSFQIRLFDYYRESRVSIPPVEFGIEVREPVASEDHDNEVNNAIVGYSIAKVVNVLNEDVGDTFDDNGNYNKTDWATGDRISQGKLNKIEDALVKINQNEINDKNFLNKQMTSNFNVLQSQIDNMVIESGSADAEVEQARGEYKLLNQRLNAMNETDVELVSQLEVVSSQLADIENEIDINGVKVHFPQRALNKADCIVIETKETVTVIDVGWETDSANLVDYLKDKGINKINNIIISHYHDDHIGGVTGQGLNSFINSSLDFSNCICYLPHKDIDYTKFIDTVENGISNRIKTAYNSVVNYLNSKGITIKNADEGEILKLNDLTSLKLMNVSSTYLNEYYNQTLNNNDEEQGYTCYNNFSLVCELKHLKNKFLFSGDIELKAQELLLNNLNNNYDVYKVEHHGVNKSTYKDYLYKINPKIAVVQNRSPFDLKGKMTTTYLFNKGCKLYDNTNCGDIIVNSNGVDIRVNSITESKINIGFDYCGQPYDLRRGIPIKENDDLNRFTDLGIYYSETSTITSSLQNKPDNISNSGFKLIVQARQTDTSPIQTIIDSNTNIFIRSYSSNSFNEWKKVSTKPDGFIECTLSSPHTTISTSVEKLNIDTIICSRSDNLTLVDGNIVVGSGVNTIRVSGQIGWSSDASGSNVLEGYVYKNDRSVIRNGITTISTYFGVPLTSKIIDVQEGDKISLYARSRTKEGFTVSDAVESTWICVEVI